MNQDLKEKYYDNAEGFLTEVVGIDEYRLMKDTGESIDNLIRICPFCDEKQVVQNGESDTYVCLHCGREFSENDNDIVKCAECGEFFIGDRDSGCICAKCFAEKMEED